MAHLRQRLFLLALTGLALTGAGLNAGSASALTLNVFTDPYTLPGLAPNGTIGFAYAGDKFVGSVYNSGTNVLYSCDLNGGNLQLFAPTINVAGGNPEEHFVTSSLGKGGFPSRHIYVGSSAGNSIIHIDNAGTSGNTFVSGLTGTPRGILFDAVGTFGFDMLVTTNNGDIYRVNSAGTASLLASVGEDTEGLDIAPLGAGFGSFDGQLIVASENSGLIRAISPSGQITVLGGLNIPGAEELTFVPLNLGASGNPVEGFYGANYTPNVVKADAGDFAGFQGDVVVTSETQHSVNLVQWNGSGFNVNTLGYFPNQPEDGIFVTSAIIHPIPEPSAMLLLGGGLLGAALWRGRRKARVPHTTS
jgi:hypothetical protein